MTPRCTMPSLVPAHRCVVCHASHPTSTLFHWPLFGSVVVCENRNCWCMLMSQRYGVHWAEDALHLAEYQKHYDDRYKHFLIVD